MLYQWNRPSSCKWRFLLFNKNKVKSFSKADGLLKLVVIYSFCSVESMNVFDSPVTGDHSIVDQLQTEAGTVYTDLVNLESYASFDGKCHTNG